MKIVIILWQSLKNSLKINFFSIIFLQIFSALFDLLVIVFLYEFIKKVLNTKITTQSDIAFFSTTNDPIISISLFFIFIIVVSGLLKILLIKHSNKFAFEVGANASSIFYKKILNMTYLYHTKKNSSELVNMVFHKTNSVVYELVLPFLAITSTLFMSIGILVALFYINFIATVLMITLTILIYVTLFKISNKVLVKNGEIVNKKSDQALKALQEGLRAIRHIIIDNSHDFFIKDYEDKNKQLRFAQANNQFTASFPRAIIESLALLILVLATLILYLFNANTLEQYIPLLVAVVLAIQRFLPGMHQVYHSIATIRGGLPLFKNIEELMNENECIYIKNQNHITFNSSIHLNNITFKYENKTIFKNFSLFIKKGQRIGICGKTGTGKSTLVDLIMGLYFPESGHIELDGIKITEENVISYRRLFSQVDQNAYLVDDSIKKNIALGIDEINIDMGRMENSARMAQAFEFINNLQNKFSEFIGENGFNLSGGERQRLSLARALYKNSDILILDEFTSSLDVKTEKAVMESMNSIDVNKTIIMIAHRVNTLTNCDVIIELLDNNAYQIHEKKV